MKETKKNWKCKLGWHNWNYLPVGHSFKEGGEFLKTAIFLGHVEQIRQCRDCFKLEAKHNYSGYSFGGSSIITTVSEWEDLNFVMKYIDDNFVKKNRMRAW